VGQTLRVFVVGQSPQPDIEAQIALAAFGISLRLEGALDGMTREQIAAEAAPRSDADRLFAALSTGETVTISKEVVTARLAGRLEDTGPALLCSTAAFPGLPRRSNIIQPSDLLNAMVDVLVPVGTLGLFVAFPEQEDALVEERSRPGVRTVATTLRIQSEPSEIDAACIRISVEKPDLVILDSMSYTYIDRAQVAGRLPCLVVLPIAAAAGAAAGLLNWTTCAN
jgi:protein AroM